MSAPAGSAVVLSTPWSTGGTIQIFRKTKSTSSKPSQRARQNSRPDVTRNRYIKLESFYGFLSAQNRAHRGQARPGRLLGHEVRSQTGQPHDQASQLEAGNKKDQT